MSNRWAFEALGRHLGLDGRFASDPSQLGAWVSALRGDATGQTAALRVMVLIGLAGTVAVLRRRIAPR